MFKFVHMFVFKFFNTLNKPLCSGCIIVCINACVQCVLYILYTQKREVKFCYNTVQSSLYIQNLMFELCYSMFCNIDNIVNAFELLQYM